MSSEFTSQYPTPSTTTDPPNPMPGMPSSFHPAGVNAAFMDSRVVFLSDQIEPLVYAQLMTSNHKMSDLQYNNVFESNNNVPQPTDSSY
jgi:hypothetical protein